MQNKPNKKWLKRGLWALLIAGLGVGAGLAWKQRAAKPETPKYRTANIDAGAITQVILATGTLQPVITVNVGTQVSGTVLERNADFNDHVKKGQVLLRLDPSALKARLRQANAQLASAQASLNLARATLERNQRLVAQGFISALTLDQNKHEYEAGLANIEQAKAQVDAAKTDLDNSVIRSPVDGVVIKRNTDVGQTVAASFQTPDLYQIAQDLRKMQIYTNVSEANVGLIQLGQAVRFSVDAFPEREFEGQVQQYRLNASNTQGVVTYNIVVNVDNSQEMLKPGMTAQTKIVVASKPKVLRLPTAALRFKPDEDAVKAISAAASSAASASTLEAKANPDDDGVLASTRGGARIYRVYTVGEHQVPKMHEVTIGISNTRFTEMASGDLKAGDAVITRLAQLPGSKE